jgi:hypothetical protein
MSVLLLSSGLLRIFFYDGQVRCIRQCMCRRRTFTQKGKSSERFDDLAGTNASRADISANRPSVLHYANAADIRTPHPRCLFIGMAHIVSKLNGFIADFAFSHTVTSIMIPVYTNPAIRFKPAKQVFS